MKPVVFKSFMELARVVAPCLKQAVYRPEKPAVASYRLVDAAVQHAGPVVYETKDKDDPVLLGKMQTLRQKNKVHWIDIQYH